MTPPFKTKEFLELKKIWDKKLAKSGFEDIEQKDEKLKIWSSHFFKVRFNATVFEAKEEYYRMAGQFLHDHRFKNEMERVIWELHSNGISVKDIRTTLKRNKYKTYVVLIYKVIRELNEIMLKRCQVK